MRCSIGEVLFLGQGKEKCFFLFIFLVRNAFRKILFHNQDMPHLNFGSLPVPVALDTPRCRR